jgi:hypothetical protein
VEVASVAPAGVDPDGDGEFESARPLTFIGDTAYASGGVALDESVIGFFTDVFDISIGIFVPGPSEVDIFSLGLLKSGDHIRVTTRSIATAIGELFGAADDGFVVMLVDEAEVILGSPEAAPIPIEVDGQYFLATIPLVVGAPYELEIRRLSNLVSSPPRSQVLLLDFEGGDDLNVLIPSQTGAIVIDSLSGFDLSEINPDLSGFEEFVKLTTRQIVEAIYADYDVTVVVDRAEAADLGAHSRVIITSDLPGDTLGNSSFSTAGINPQFDFENVDLEETGIVFAGLERFRPTSLSGPRALAVQLAMIAAHELGHALGLMHVVESSGGLMRPVIAVDALTVGEAIPRIVRAELAEARIGVQDAPAYLRRVVGSRDPAEVESIRAALLFGDPAAKRPPTKCEAYRCWRSNY